MSKENWWKGKIPLKRPITDSDIIIKTDRM